MDIQYKFTITHTISDQIIEKIYRIELHRIKFPLSYRFTQT